MYCASSESMRGESEVSTEAARACSYVFLSIDDLENTDEVNRVRRERGRAGDLPSEPAC